MKSSLAKRIGFMVGVAVLSGSAVVIAQPSAEPLGVQGLDQAVINGARTRAMGGTTVANANDAFALFSNPAALSQLQSFEIRVGGLFESNQREQTQNWIPSKDLPGLSVLFESLTGGIKTLDSAGSPYKNPWLNVQRQYDNLGPNWSTTTSKTRPFSVAAAMPLTLAGMDITAAIGFAPSIDLTSYYQNNNSMTPYLGNERPFVQWSQSVDTVGIQWYQYIRSREGSVVGITPGFSIAVLPDLILGGSVSILSGSSDDFEQRTDRGHLSVAVVGGKAKNFLLDTVYYYQTKTGTSDYSGNIFTLGFLFRQPRYTLGITVKPAMTLSRTWNRNVVSLDSTKKPIPVRIDSVTSRSFTESGQDDLKFPLAYSVGLMLTPTDRWTFAFDYEVRGLSDVELTSQTNGTAGHPWVSSKASWRIGAEFRASDMIALRAGYHEATQSFSPDGSAIVGQPASGEIYSLGAGFKFDNILLNLSYEYSILKYQDIYQSNINFNARYRNQVLMELAYRF